MSEQRVGVIGCGLISAAHLKAWRAQEGFALGGIFDLDQALATKRSREFDVPVMASLEALLERCDVVDVCTPPQTHARLATAALAAGRHVVMEKPVVTRVEDWTAIRESLRTSGAKLAVIHNLKFLHSVQEAKRWVDDGRIGEPIRIQREFMTSPSTDRMLVGSGHWSHSLPGGRWFETLPHELYLTDYFVGALDVASVVTVQTSKAPPGAPADEVLIALKGERTIGTIHFSANCEQNRRVFTIHGTRGTIAVDLLSDLATLSTTPDGKFRRAVGGMLLDASRTLARSGADRSRYAWQHLRGESPHQRIIAQFALHLRGLGEHPTPLSEVDYVVRNCERIGREIDRQVARDSA